MSESPIPRDFNRAPATADAARADDRFAALPVLAPDHPRSALIPVTPIDECFLLFEEQEGAYNYVWLCWIRNEPLDSTRTMSAIRKTFERHPKAAARLVRATASLDARLYWEPVEGADERAWRIHPPEGTVEDPAWVHPAWIELMHLPIDLAVGPPVEFHWFPRTTEFGVLAVRAHHAVGDGHGSLTLLEDFFRFYNGADASVPATDSGRRAPVVSGSWLRKLRLVWRLIKFQTQRVFRYQFAPPVKLFAESLPLSTRFDSQLLILSRERLRSHLNSAKAQGVSFNDYLIAAHCLAIERWKSSKKEDCGTIRVLVNQSLRSGEEDSGELENRVSGFSVWIDAAERKDPARLLQQVHRQVQDCLNLRIAEGIAVLSPLLTRLPRAIARRIVTAGAKRTQDADTLVVGNMGRVDLRTTGDSGATRVGAGELFGLTPIPRPAKAVGLSTLATSFGGQLFYSAGFLSPGISRDDARQLLGFLQKALDELAALPLPAESLQSGNSPLERPLLRTGAIDEG